MQSDSLKLILDFASPLVDGLQTAIVAWVAYRTAGTSRDVQWTSRVAADNYVTLHQLLGRSVSLPTAPGRKKSS